MNYISSHRPDSIARLCELVRAAKAEAHAIYPHGGRTMLDFGLPPSRPGVAVDTTALDQVIDYPARDMTITMQAGITIARLQEILATENQRLPIDVPLPEQATLGGAIACNVSGPRRYGFGTFRDYIIGISVVNDRGEEVKAGGRVVKNVAGYDLCKLYTGSLGTLGIITQVTLKVRPGPEACAIVGIECTANQLGELLNRLHATATRPVCMEVESTGPARSDFAVYVGFEGSAAAVNWQTQQLERELRDGFRCAVRMGPAAQIDLDRLCRREQWPRTCKATLLPSAGAQFLIEARRLAGRVRAHAGNGVVYFELPNDWSLAHAHESIAVLRRLASENAGTLVVTRCPDVWKAEIGVWGEPRGDWELMRAVKRQLDPQDLFNPGRFVGGI